MTHVDELWVEQTSGGTLNGRLWGISLDPPGTFVIWEWAGLTPDYPNKTRGLSKLSKIIYQLKSMIPVR